MLIHNMIILLRFIVGIWLVMNMYFAMSYMVMDKPFRALFHMVWYTVVLIVYIMSEKDY
jgi:hypothetical protein